MLKAHHSIYTYTIVYLIVVTAVVSMVSHKWIGTVHLVVVVRSILEFGLNVEINGFAARRTQRLERDLEIIILLLLSIDRLHIPLNLVPVSSAVDDRSSAKDREHFGCHTASYYRRISPRRTRSRSPATLVPVNRFETMMTGTKPECFGCICK